MKPATGLLALTILAASCSAGSDGAGGTVGAASLKPQPMPSAAASPSLLPASPAPSPPEPEFVPAPDRAIPRHPTALAQELITTTEALHRSIDAWTQLGDPSEGEPPEALVLQALYQQRIIRFLARRTRLAERTLPLLPTWLRGETRANTKAAAELFSIVRPISRPSRFRTGPPEPAGVLLGWFRKAERRFKVDWELLAAVMYVESKFGRVLSTSTAGAQGPMQFIPSTWAAYGMGGDVHDPHDAIMGAANYLHRSGAPGDDRQALYAYNHSRAYVNAVLRYTNQMKRERRNYYAYYNWQVFVLTTSGDRRLTGPGL